MSKNSDRKFDTWEWYDTDVYSKRLTFDVRLDRPVNVAEGPLRYYIHNDDPPIKVSAPDLALLRNQLDEAVRAFYAVAWTSVIVVRIEQDLSEAGAIEDFGVNVVVGRYEIGQMFGKPVYRRKRGGKIERTTFDYFIRDGEIEREFSQYSGEKRQPQYILPDTPEVHGQIEALRTGLTRWIDGARDRLVAKALP